MGGAWEEERGGHAVPELIVYLHPLLPGCTSPRIQSANQSRAPVEKGVLEVTIFFSLCPS